MFCGIETPDPDRKAMHKDHNCGPILEGIAPSNLRLEVVSGIIMGLDTDSGDRRACWRSSRVADPVLTINLCRRCSDAAVGRRRGKAAAMPMTAVNPMSVTECLRQGSSPGQMHEVAYQTEKRSRVQTMRLTYAQRIKVPVTPSRKLGQYQTRPDLLRNIFWKAAYRDYRKVFWKLRLETAPRRSGGADRAAMIAHH